MRVDVVRVFGIVFVAVLVRVCRTVKVRVRMGVLAVMMTLSGLVVRVRRPVGMRVRGVRWSVRAEPYSFKKCKHHSPS